MFAHPGYGGHGVRHNNVPINICISMLPRSFSLLPNIHTHTHHHHQVRMVLDFRNKGRPTVNRDMSKLDGVATRYRSSLKQWVDTLEERDRVEGHYQTIIFDMKSTLEERIKRADDISKAYKHFRLEVAKSAEHSKTCRPISDRLLAQLEGMLTAMLFRM